MAVLSIIRGKCADFRAKMVEHSGHLPAGTPRLIVVGREVQLGNGRADLIAIVVVNWVKSARILR
jgi:hypothetical protein